MSNEHWRGNPIYLDASCGEWRFTDSNRPVRDCHQDKPCGKCGQMPTAEGHDPCLGELPGVVNACCGHGRREEAYIQFATGVRVAGFDSVEHPATEDDA